MWCVGCWDPRLSSLESKNTMGWRSWWNWPTLQYKLCGSKPFFDIFPHSWIFCACWEGSRSRQTLFLFLMAENFWMVFADFWKFTARTRTWSKDKNFHKNEATKNQNKQLFLFSIYANWTFIFVRWKNVSIANGNGIMIL